MTKKVSTIDASFIAGLKTRGLSDVDIEDAASIAFHFNLINRLADAFDFALPNEKQRRRQAAILDVVAKKSTGPRPSPSYAPGQDGIVRPVELNEFREAVLQTVGATAPALRVSMESTAALHMGATREASPPPTQLVAYAETLAKYASAITDEEVAALHKAGYDDEALFELTLAGAMGAAFAGIEAVFQASATDSRPNE
tara:strand:+ start:4435 stop:5031 length:597 start_codon:yes stop_codon:yes gene_type:complete